MSEHRMHEWYPMARYPVPPIERSRPPKGDAPEVARRDDPKTEGR